MPTRQFGALRALLTGGTDRAGGGAGPVVVLLHGFGAPGDDLVPLHRVIDAPPGTRWVFPEAPLEPPELYGGRAWWRIDLARMQLALERGEARDLTREVPEGLGEARDRVMSLLDAVERELGVPGSRVVLGGFSQGAMLSLDVALRSDRALAGLVLMSGTLLAEDEWVPRMPARRGMQVLQSHGQADPLLPFGIAERLRDELARAGCEVTWIPFRGQHEIPGSVTDALGPFLRGVLG
jgi:phospholipase/carboxylesterase